MSRVSQNELLIMKVSSLKVCLNYCFQKSKPTSVSVYWSLERALVQVLYTFRDKQNASEENKNA
jgi:hypothetical protein